MFPISLYAIIVWYVVLKHRRTWRGVAAVVAGAALVLPAADPLVYAVWWFTGDRPTWLFPFLYGYAALLTLVGFFLVSLPRQIASDPCARCRYDLAGAGSRRCPECGAENPRRGNAPPQPRRARASATVSPITRAAPKTPAPITTPHASPPPPV